MGFGGNYSGGAEQAKAMSNALSPHSFTLNDRIKQAISEGEARLAAAKRAEEILTKNPELEELLNLLQRF
jgi:hypothetical protein